MAEYNAGTVKATMTADGKGYHAAVDSIKKKDQELKQSAQEVQASYKELGITAGASFAAITAGIWKGIQANNELKASMMGLDSIAKGTVGTYSKIEAELEKIREDGMIPLTNAIQAYKNLLMRYEDEETAIRMFNRLADAAAFGRQGQLSLGDAIQSATEGLKNENSVLVDNAGVTKNVSVMWKEYADQLGKTVSQLTDAEKRQAEVNGFMEETRHQVGDLAKLQNSLAGELSKASAAGRDTAAAFGDALEPAASRVVAAYTGIVQGMKEFIQNSPGVAAAVGTGALAFTGLLTGASGLSMLLPKLSAGFKLLTSGPLGLTILGITTLTSVVAGITTAIQKQREEQAKLADSYRDQADEVDKLIEEYEQLSQKAEKTKEDKQRIIDLSNQIAEILPQAAAGYDEEGNAILDLNAALREMVLLKGKELEIRSQELGQRVQEEEERLRKAEKRRADLEAEWARRQQRWETWGQYPEQERLNELAEEYNREWRKITAEIDSANKSLTNYKQQQKDIQDILTGVTPEWMRRERKKRQEKKPTSEEKDKPEEDIKKRERLEAELADRLFELTRTETEVKIRELDKQRKAYENAKIKEIEVDGQKFTLAQWYEMEETRILDEEAEKRKAIEQELLDWQNQARLASMDGFEKQIEQYELDRQAALEAARAKFKDAEQLKQAEAAINQYYDALITQTEEEEAEKQKQIAENLAKWQEDWQNRARLALMEEYDQRVTQYELDREAALKEAKKKLEDEEQYKQAELAINQYYDALIAQTREEQADEEKRAFDKRIKDAEEAIRKEYGLEQQLTEREKKELLQRLQNELAALEAMEDASTERIEALKNVIDDLSADIPDLTDLTRQWTESLVDGLSQAIVRGESLSDVFENLLQTITQYLIKQAMMGALTAAGFPSFHGGGEVPQRFHWGGVVDAFAGAIRAHGGLKLAADEVPIIAQTGERVLSRAENAAYEAGWKPQVDIQIINNTGTPIEARRETEFDGPRTVVRFFLEGYSRNIDGIQRILQPR